MAEPATDEEVRASTGVTGLKDELAKETSAPFGMPLSDDRSIYERMARVLAELPAIGKTSENTQQHFMFRGHDDVLNALNPLLAEHGVFVVPEVLERVTGERTTGRGATMYEVNLHVQFTFYGLLGDTVVASTWGEGTDMGDKATSKAMTMAFKTVLAQAFAVSTKEGYDPDSGSPEETSRGTRPSGGNTQRRPQATAPVDNRVRARNWTDPVNGWIALMADHGVPTIDSAEWLRLSVEAADLDKTADADKIFQAANVALGMIAEHEGDLQFTVGARSIVRAAFAAGFGQDFAVVGPAWRLDPEETDRLTYVEHQKAIEAEAAAVTESGHEAS